MHVFPGVGHKELACLLLRVTLGLVFLFYGVDKFLDGPRAFASGLSGRFGETWLPSGLVRSFGVLLPVAEVALGALLTLGIFTRVALAGSGVLLILLTVGATVQGQGATVADNVLFSLVVFTLLFFSEHDVLALDRLRQPRSAPVRSAARLLRFRPRGRRPGGSGQAEG